MLANGKEMCHNIIMNEKKSRSKVIEPEILDEQGNIISRQDTAHTYHKVGALTGFFAIAFSVVFLLVGAIVTVFIITPLLLVGRLLGLQIRRLKK